MKLSTRSRYGTRLMLDMAGHYNKGVVQLGEIAKRLGISVKYLEQIIIPLKKARYVKSVRGAKGGYMLAKSPDEITAGEIVELLEGGMSFAECTENPECCERADTCLTRNLWKKAARAARDTLHSVTLSDLLRKDTAA